MQIEHRWLGIYINWWTIRAMCTVQCAYRPCYVLNVRPLTVHKLRYRQRFQSFTNSTISLFPLLLSHRAFSEFTTSMEISIFNSIFFFARALVCVCLHAFFQLCQSFGGHFYSHCLPIIVSFSFSVAGKPFILSVPLFLCIVNHCYSLIEKWKLFELAWCAEKKKCEKQTVSILNGVEKKVLCTEFELQFNSQMFLVVSLPSLLLLFSWWSRKFNWYLQVFSLFFFCLIGCCFVFYYFLLLLLRISSFDKRQRTQEVCTQTI